MLNKISVSGRLSHIMKVCENLKFAVQRCKVALPSEDISDPSAVLRLLLQAGFWFYGGP